MEIGTVKQTDVREEMQGAYLDYAMSVITARALPDIRDGLKPVQRRILYAMNEMGLRHNQPYKKSARIVGDTLGRYHPHGDASVYDSLVRMAQDFTMRYPLIDGQGNFGCFTGDTKIKLLDGAEKSFAELAELDPHQVFYVYSVDQDGRIVIGEGRNARLTRRGVELIELTLDNDEIIRCTPDHRFMLRDGSYKHAQDLTLEDSLMPGYFDSAPVKEGLNDYLRVFQPTRGEYEFVHRAASKYNHRVIAKRWLDERADVYDITVDKYHNFLLASGVFVHNSIDNDPPAAMRYTEARLTELAEELLLDLDKDTVDFKPNFDETLKEPTVLPAKVPNLLLNGTAGIAVGMATLIPPHNLNEIVDATGYLIDHWHKIDEIEPDDLLQFVKGPDFPTGGIILGTDGIKEAYATGKGRIVVRAKIHTEQAAGGRARIVVTEIPYQVNKSALIERIAELVRDRRVEEIGDLRDESDRQGMSIIIELKRSVDPTPVINQLLKYTALQTAFSVNMLALVDGEPRVLSLKRALQLYVQHRQVVITRRTQYELERAKLREHILQGLKIALDHLDEVIRTIRQSPDADVARERLMKRFKLTEIQATAILDMQLRRLAALERKKIEDELAEVLKRISYLEDLLRSPKKILGVIKEELGDLKDRFGDARRTFIAATPSTSETEFKAETSAEEAEAIVSLTREGYIRRAPLSQYRRTRSDAVKGVQSREDDPVEHLFVANTRDNLVLLTNRGRALPFRMSQVPDVARNPTGISIKNQLEAGERFVAALPLNGAQFVTLATPGGKIKRTASGDLANLPSGGARAINLAEGDELGWARATNGGGELLLVTARGQALRFKEDDVPVQGRAAAGVRAMKLAEGDRVVAMEPAVEDAVLVIASAKGFAKRVALKEFPARGRYTAGVTAFAPDAKTGEVAAARVIDLADDLMFITRNGVVVRMRVENMAKGSRGARGKLAVEVKGEDGVAALASLVGTVERAQVQEEAEAPVVAPASEATRGNGHAARSPERERKPRAERTTRRKSKENQESPPGRKPRKASSERAAPTKESAGEEKQSELDLPLASFKPLPRRIKN